MQSSESCNASPVVDNGSRARLLAPLEDPLVEGEVDIDDAEEEEDAAPARHAASPSLPTDEGEIERHRVDHYPFRSWCKFCISGRGTGRPHTTTASNSTIPVVGMDYYFITSEGVRRRDELKFAADELGNQQLAEARRTGEVIKCIIVRCMSTKNVMTHVVPQKGNDEEQYCANLAVEDLKWLGHTRVILKSDNERSIGALRARVARIMKVQEHVVNVQEEAPNTYDSQSNGGVEVGIRLVRGMFRTLKLCLEARLQKYMPINHAVTPWLLEHVSMIINSRCRGSDGMTPWQRLKGRNFRQMILGFGENILYKLPSKGPRSQPDGNMGTRWLEGTFLGYSKSSNTYIIATEDGITTARSLYRRPMANRWNHEKVAAIAATPWSIRDKPVPAQLADNAEATTEQTEPPQPAPIPHAFRIAYQDLVEHGFTRDLPAVRAQRTARQVQAWTVTHEPVPQTIPRRADDDSERTTTARSIRTTDRQSNSRSRSRVRVATWWPRIRKSCSPGRRRIRLGESHRSRDATCDPSDGAWDARDSTVRQCRRRRSCKRRLL